MYRSKNSEYQDGANIADFCTSVTFASERRVKEGKEHDVPNTVAEFAKIFRKSDIAKGMQHELEDHLRNQSALKQETEGLQNYVQQTKAKYAPKKGPHTVSIFTQLKSATRREFALRWADKPTLFARNGTTFIVSFLLGSTFYNMPLTTNGSE